MTSPRKLVVVVEDDEEVAQLIVKTLRSFQFDVVHVTRGADLMKSVKASRPAACVIDLGLPDCDGLDLIKKLEDSGIAILAVTGRGDVADRIVGLEIGADDYIVKPFEPRELVARVNSVLRRMGRAAEPHAVASFSGWSFDVDAFSLTSPAGQRIRLSRAEAQVLELFVRSPNRVLTREHLLDACGTAEDAFDRSIDVRISRLRQKLGDDPKNPRIIRTIYGSGYLFAGPVEWSKAG
ncbi:MAG TPA: response regulator transcription factor [Haliangiales bacterium]|nr:response regulator transcription factor [Haliangiales bacterium]